MSEASKAARKQIDEYKKSIAFRSISAIVAMLVIFAIIVGVIGYKRFSAAVLEQYTDGAFLTADTAASIIDGDDLYRLSQSKGETGEYRRVMNELQALCNSTDSTFIYVIQPNTTDYKHIKFLFSVANYDSRFTPYGFGYLRETTNDEYREKYARLYERRTHREVVIRDKGYIETDKHITALVPIRGSDNNVKALLCVQRQLDVLDKVREDYIFRVILVLVLLALFVILAQSAYLHITLLDPLSKIIAEAQRFAGESSRKGQKLTDIISNKDEIGQLAGSIDQMEERIQTYVEDIKQITAERERIDAELSLAKRIQEDMLPNDFPAFPERTEFDIYASMTPAKEVGGDFYDFFLIDDDHLALVMADVSGKGIPAALFMMVSKIMIQNQAMGGITPAQVLEAVNDQIGSNNREEMFVTVWLGILDLRTGIMTASNAGHEYPILKRPDGSFAILKDKHGFVIGGMEDMMYFDYQIEFPKGSKLFLYTDGLPEAQGQDGSFYGNDRTLEVLNKHADGSPQEILEAVSESVYEFVGSAPQFDDLTMMCIESNIE